jgi:hypothetical protein
MLNYCNYHCHYCPFVKDFVKKENLETHLADCEVELKRFIGWIKNQHEDRFSILVIPRGEGLIFPWYQRQLIELSHCENIKRITCQTNLSWDPGWLQNVNKSTLSLWITYHPLKITITHFLRKCSYLLDHDIKFSVGAVGLKEFIDPITKLRENLPEFIYVWVNAYKDKVNYYTDNDVREFKLIDPYFGLNLCDYDNDNKRCLAGESSFLVSVNGNVQRCYQDREIIGNIYEHELWEISSQLPCSMNMCTCFIGYINIPRLNPGRIYGENVISRIPVEYKNRGE